MKKYIFPIIVICSFVLFNNCNKLKYQLDPYFTDLSDTIVSSQWASYSSYFDLDVDKDNTDDLMLVTYSSYSGGWGGYSESYVKVYPSNGYEIAFSDCISTSWSWYPGMDTIYNIDTIMVPKAFQLGDTIFSDGDYTQDQIMISYNYSPVETDYSIGRHYTMQENTNYYLAFRKMSGTNSKLAWLRVNSHGANIISLNSCRYIENETSLTIE